MLEILSSWDFGSLMKVSHDSAYTFEWPLVGTHRATSLRMWYPINAAGLFFFFFKDFLPIIARLSLKLVETYGL